MHAKALNVMKQYSKENNGDKDKHWYENETESQLRRTVGEEYWDKGHQYFRRHLRMTMNPSPAIDQVVNPRPSKRLRCDELPTSFDLLELYQSGIGKTILSYAGRADLCALDLVNKEFNALTTEQWKVITKDRFGMDNGKEGWKIGTSFLRSPVFVHNAGGKGVLSSFSRITANESILVDVSDTINSRIWIRDASNLDTVRTISSQNQKVSVCGQVGSEIIVTSYPRRVNALRRDFTQGDFVQQLEYATRNDSGIEIIGCETHLIVAHDGQIQLYEVNHEQQERVHTINTTELLCLRKDIRVEEGAEGDTTTLANLGVLMIRKLAWAPNKKHFIVGYPHQICVWKFEAAKNEITLVKTITIPVWEVTNVALAEDYIIASSKDRKVHIWNRTTGDKVVYGLTDGTTKDALCDVGVTLGPRTFPIRPLHFSCHGHILVSTSHIGCALCVWDMKTGKLLKRHNEANEQGVVKMLTEGGKDVTDTVHLKKLNAFICTGEYENMWAFPTNRRQLDMAQSIRRHKDMFPKYKAFRTFRTWAE